MNYASVSHLNAARITGLPKLKAYSKFNKLSILYVLEVVNQLVRYTSFRSHTHRVEIVLPPSPNPVFMLIFSQIQNAKLGGFVAAQ